MMDNALECRRWCNCQTFTCVVKLIFQTATIITGIQSCDIWSEIINKGHESLLIKTVTANKYHCLLIERKLFSFVSFYWFFILNLWIMILVFKKLCAANGNISYDFNLYSQFRQCYSRGHHEIVSKFLFPFLLLGIEI